MGKGRGVTFDEDDFCVEFFFEGFAFGGFLPGVVVVFFVEVSGIEKLGGK